MTTKLIPCCLCKFTCEVITAVNREGFAVQYGWDVLRSHIDKSHPEYAKLLDAYLDNETLTDPLPPLTDDAEVFLESR